MTATTNSQPGTIAKHAGRHLAANDLLGEPAFQLAAWLIADPSTLSSASTGYLAATLADTHLRDAVLLAAVDADRALVDAVASGEAAEHANAIGRALNRASTTTQTDQVRATLTLIAENTRDTHPVIAAQAFAASAALAAIARDAEQAQAHALAALDADPTHRLAAIIHDGFARRAARH